MRASASAASARGRSALPTVKVMSVVPSAETFCTIMSTLTLCAASVPKIGGGDAGPVRHPAHRDLRLVARIGDAGHDLLFHDLVLIHHQRARASSLKLDSTWTRTRSFIASSTLRVCSTLAPTEASSSISS